MKLKAVRKSQNLNAMELAEKAGLDLNQPLMSAVESGKVLFTPSDLQAVCEALQCTPLDLFDNTDEFDLMAVQHKFDASESIQKLMSHYSKPPYKIPEHVPDKFIKLRVFHEPNQKRSFRMSDEKWHNLQAVIKWLGYNSLGAYLNSLADELQSKQA